MENRRPSKKSASDSEEQAPARRSRLSRGKTAAAPRARKKAAAPESAPELPFSSESTAVDQPVQAREFAPAPVEAAPPPAAPESREPSRTEAPPPETDIPAGNVFSFSPDEPSGPSEPVSPGEPAAAGERSAVESDSTDQRRGDAAPASAESATGGGEPAGAAQAEEQPRSFQPQSGQGGGFPQGGKRYGREYWKQLKLEKKKAKMLRHQQGGPQGGGQAPAGPAPQERGGGRFERPVRERPPLQPPPPNFVSVTGELPATDRFADLAALETTAIDLASGGGEPLEIDKLVRLPLAELTAFAKAQGVTFDGVPGRHQVMKALLQFAAERKRPILDHGWLDLTDRGFGFIVHDHDNYRLFPTDTYLPESFVKRYGIKRGVELSVQVQPPAANERCPSVVKINSAMGQPPEALAKVVPFEELIPYYPLKRILLEVSDSESKDISMRLVDIVTPIGFGQRGLIVAPPRTGKTVLLQNIANSVSANFPETKLIILLVDERPEEVTDFKRHTKGEVVSSTFDESPESHVHCAEMVIEKSRRLIEAGQHVVILLDSITRLARAYNALASNSGKIMSGGIEATALQKPKRFFGSARNIEDGASLTIVGTALVDTGSKMDEVIFEEFKGTGNMELHLDRDLVNKRIFPAVNLDKSGTRKEELIYHPDEMLRIYSLRRAMQGIPGTESMEMLISRLKKTRTNVEFLMSLNR